MQRRIPAAGRQTASWSSARVRRDFGVAHRGGSVLKARSQLYMDKSFRVVFARIFPKVLPPERSLLRLGFFFCAFRPGHVYWTPYLAVAYGVPYTRYATARRLDTRARASAKSTHAAAVEKRTPFRVKGTRGISEAESAETILSMKRLTP